MLDSTLSGGVEMKRPMGGNRALTTIYYMFEDPSYFKDRRLHTLAQFIHISLSILILISVVAVCCESEPSMSPDPAFNSNGIPGSAEWEPFWSALEVFVVICFTIDWSVRLAGAASAKQLKEFRADPMNWIDVGAILPFYIQFILDNFIDLRFLRVIRLARCRSATDFICDCVHSRTCPCGCCRPMWPKYLC